MATTGYNSRFELLSHAESSLLPMFVAVFLPDVPDLCLETIDVAEDCVSLVTRLRKLRRIVRSVPSPPRGPIVATSAR